MAITYPLSIPNFPDSIGRLRWTYRTATLATESPFSFVQQIQNLPGQMLTAQFTSTKLKGVAACEAWVAFLASLNGRKGTFLLGDPVNNSPRGVATGVPVIDGASQTGNTINTRGWTPDVTGILLAGDWFQVGSGLTSRLYKVLQDANSDGAGNSSLEIWPSLRDKPADGTAITTEGPVGLFRLASSENSYDWQTGEIIQMTLNAGEAI